MSFDFRPGTVEDSYNVFRIFYDSIADFANRYSFGEWSRDPKVIDGLWDIRRPLYEHLARTGEQFWLAYENDRLAGYARSILRDGLLELTEFFVHPESQSAGLGRQLLERAFPGETGDRNVIIATTEVRALARYLKAGVYARFPIYAFSRNPRELDLQSDLEYLPITGSDEDFNSLRAIDSRVLDHTRDPDHTFWISTKRGFLYRRNGQAVGYGYIDRDGGPFALLNEEDFPAVLTHAERVASLMSDGFYLEVPLINKFAVDHLISNGYELSSFLSLFMSDVPFGQFDHYIIPSPPFFL